jgi:hypothetical protein
MTKTFILNSGCDEKGPPRDLDLYAGAFRHMRKQPRLLPSWTTNMSLAQCKEVRRLFPCGFPPCRPMVECCLLSHVAGMPIPALNLLKVTICECGSCSDKKESWPPVDEALISRM